MFYVFKVFIISLFFVGGIDEEGLPRPAAADHVDVVVHRSHHNLVNLNPRVVPNHVQISHAHQRPTP